MLSLNRTISPKIFKKIAQQNYMLRLKKSYLVVIFLLSSLSFANAQIIEIGKCYTIDGYETQNTWNDKDYQNSNTLHYKFLKEPKRDKLGGNTSWEINATQVLLFEEDEIKYYQDLGYNQINKAAKHVLSIDFNNGTVTRLLVWSDDLIDFHYKKINILKKLKKTYPGKWTSGSYGDQRNLGSLIKIVSNKTIIDKYKIETYVDGLIIGRELSELNYTNGSAIKVDLNTMKYRWGFFDTIVKEPYDKQCNENYKNVVTKKNKVNKKSNSAIKKLLKKLY